MRTPLSFTGQMCFFTWEAKNKDANVIDLYDISDSRELKIIGNIYENKELI